MSLLGSVGMSLSPPVFELGLMTLNAGKVVKEIKSVETPSESHLFWIAILAFGTLFWLFLT